MVVFAFSQVYEGVAKMGFIPPQVLADHDVILTTYSTLRSDFYHLGSKQGQWKTSCSFQKFVNELSWFDHNFFQVYL